MNWKPWRKHISCMAAVSMAWGLGTVPSAAMEIHATRTYQKIYLDEELVTWKVYNVNDENYVRLADLCPPIGTELLWDSWENAVYMSSNAVEPVMSTLEQDGDMKDIVQRATTFQDVITQVKKSYGSHSASQERATGLYHVSLIDFDGDGEEELLLSYVSALEESVTSLEYLDSFATITHTTEVWNYENGVAQRIHQREIQSFAEDTGLSACSLIQRGERFYLVYHDMYHTLNDLLQADATTYQIQVIGFSQGKEILEEDVSISLESLMSLESLESLDIHEELGAVSNKNHLLFQQESNIWDSMDRESENMIYQDIWEDYPLQREEGENLLLQWRQSPQSKLKVHAIQTNQRIFLDGNPVTWLIYNINDENYIRLADLCPEIGVGLLWDSIDNRVLLRSDGYMPSNRSIV